MASLQWGRGQTVFGSWGVRGSTRNNLAGLGAQPGCTKYQYTILRSRTAASGVLKVRGLENFSDTGTVVRVVPMIGVHLIGVDLESKSGDKLKKGQIKKQCYLVSTNSYFLFKGSKYFEIIVTCSAACVVVYFQY